MKKVEQSLSEAVKRGVKVEIITARKRDIPVYRNLVNANHMAHLIKNGIEIYQVWDKYLHMKGFLFDGDDVTFGSFNLDKWSWDNNNEINFACKDPMVMSYFDAVYKDIKLESRRVGETYVPVKFGRQIKLFFWENFLNACNFFMNYRNQYKYMHKREALRRVWREARGYDRMREVPEDVKKLHKRTNFEWDETIGIEH